MHYLVLEPVSNVLGTSVPRSVRLCYWSVDHLSQLSVDCSFVCELQTAR